MAKLKKQADGIYCDSLEPGTIVYDKETGGEIVVAGMFKVDGKDYETDAEGKIADPTIVEENKNVSTEGFLNPLATGVSYKEFLKAIPEGTTVEKYCEGKLTQDEITWLLVELRHYESNRN